MVDVTISVVTGGVCEILTSVVVLSLQSISSQERHIYKEYNSQVRWLLHRITFI